MWLEAQALFTLIGCVFIGLVMVLIMPFNMLYMLLLLVGIVMVVVGDVAISSRITKNHLRWLIDPLNPNEELCVLFNFDGNLDFVKTRKGPFGKREFMRYKKKASIINNGDYPVRTLNGNPAFVGHEDYDMNVNLYETEALDKLPGDDVKEIYRNLKKEGV